MNILTAKGELAAMLHGTNINQVQNLLGVFNRAARRLQSDLDLITTKRTMDLAPIYKGVFSYSCPSDLKGNKIIDIRPKQKRNETIYQSKFGQYFDLNKGKWSDLINVKHNKFVKTLQISGLNFQEPIEINKLSEITGLVGTDISNISKDIVNYVDTSSVKFDLDVAASATLEITNTAVDLSSTENQSGLFVWVYLNEPTKFSSITLRWGNDNANYYEKTITSTQSGGSFVTGWNLLSFDWDTATLTGVVDQTNIVYEAIVFNYATVTAITDIRVNSLICALGKVLECEYYSNCLFREALTGEFKQTATSDDDLINIEEEDINLFIFLAASFAVQQALGQDASFDVSYFEGLYKEALNRYKMTYKSEIQKTTNSYYKVRKSFTGRLISKIN